MKMLYAGSGTYTNKQIDVYVKSENANGRLCGFHGWKNWVDVEIKGNVYRFQYWDDVVVVKKG